MSKPLKLFSSSVYEKERCERSLYVFMSKGWQIVDSAPFIGNWHLEAICEHLQAVTDEQIRNLVINIPPRHTKSLCASVFWPAWEWGPRNKPGTRWLYTSYDRELSLRDAVKSRRVVTDSWYRRLWGDRVSFYGDQNVKGRFLTTAGGHRVTSSVKGMATGEGGTRIVVDDPHNLRPQFVNNSDLIKQVHDWYDQTMTTRQDDPKKTSRVIIMQRSSADDLVGHIQEKYGPNAYVYLVLPAEYDPKRHCVTSIGFSDPRKEPGELLWPERIGREEIDNLKLSLGPLAYSAQYQQDPAPASGVIFRTDHFRFYDDTPEQMAEDCDEIFQSWDMAFKGSERSDYVVGLVWGIKGSRRILLDGICEKLTFTQTIARMRALAIKWPKATRKIVEDKANGPAILDALGEEISGLTPFTPEGSKWSRATSVTPEFDAGNVYVPNPETSPWVADYIRQLLQFPKGAHDDYVDATSQALLKGRELAKRYEANKAPIIPLSKSSYWLGRTGRRK